MLNVIAHKPRDDHGNMYVVIEREHEHHHPYVSATANAHSLQGGEWFWGHYFQTKREALAHFNNR